MSPDTWEACVGGKFRMGGTVALTIANVNLSGTCPCLPRPHASLARVLQRSGNVLDCLFVQEVLTDPQLFLGAVVSTGVQRACQKIC